MPVYKAENYLSRCIDSILKQTFSDFELILIDDGSPDKSGKICDEYASNDKRLIVIHQENQGVSKTRQRGLETAIGEYVIHADPDDWVEPDWLETLYQEAEHTKADMVICDFERVYKDKNIYYSQKPTSLKKEDVLEDFVSGRTWGPCWNKLIRRECFQKYSISFHPDMDLWEDLYVNCMLLTKDIKVSYVERTLYHYDSFTNDDSIVRFRKDSHIHSAIIFIDKFSQILQGKRYDDIWFFRKLLVKKWVIRVPNSKFSIKNTYPEINSLVIERYGNYSLRSEERCVAFCLQDHEKIGRCLFLLIQKLRKMKKCFLR